MRLLIAGVAGLSLTFAGLGAFAQAASDAPAAAPAPAPAAAGKASVETTTIGDLLANPADKAVIAKDLPDLISYPGLDQITGMTLRDISKFPEAKLDDAKLAAIQKDLDAASAN